jgi:hypothetical protein
MNDINNLFGGGENKKTYIGYVKVKDGDIKIIPGEKDNRIIHKRNKILNHLNAVLSGGKRLKEENIKKYFSALGGKYERNNICSSGNKSNCKGGKNVSVEGAHKLLKLISKKNLPVDSALNVFRGSAPKLYEKLETKIKGGYNAIMYDSNDGNNSNGGNNRYDESGGSLASAAFSFAKQQAKSAAKEAGQTLKKHAMNAARNVARDFQNSAVEYGRKNLKKFEDFDFGNDDDNYDGGFDDRYDNRGGNDDRDDRYDNRGGYDDRDDRYDNRGGYDYRDDRYDNNMYGGDDIELNKFRNEINRFNITNLRNEILNIDL